MTVIHKRHGAAMTMCGRGFVAQHPALSTIWRRVTCKRCLAARYTR